MRELPVHFVGDGALLQHHDHVACSVRKGGDMKVNKPLARIARCAKIDFVFVYCGPTRAHLLDQGQKRASEGHQVAQLMPTQQR